jgi:hypothetical protein
LLDAESVLDPEMFASTHNTDDEENESDAAEDTDQALSLKDDCDDVEISVVDDHSEENDSKLANSSCRFCMEGSI